MIYSAKEILSSPALLEEFQNRKPDSFTKAASTLYNVPAGEITRNQYLKAKAHVQFHARLLKLNKLVLQTK